MLVIRLIVACGSVYIYNFLLGELKGVPPLKWLPNNSVSGLLFKAVGVFIFLSVLIWPYYREMKMRTGEMKNMAADNGLVYHEGTYHPGPSLRQSPLLRRGFRRSFGPAVTGIYRGAEIQLMDHVYSEPGETSDDPDTRYFRTVAVFHEPGLQIPEFIMVRKDLGERLFESLFGSGAITFEEDPDFSEKYAINGPDQHIVQKLFAPELRSAFTRSETRWAAGVVDNRFILFSDYGPDDEVKPGEFEDCLETTWQIFSTLKKESKRATDG